MPAMLQFKFKIKRYKFKYHKMNLILRLQTIYLAIAC